MEKHPQYIDYKCTNRIYGNKKVGFLSRLKITISIWGLHYLPTLSH